MDGHAHCFTKCMGGFHRKSLGLIQQNWLDRQRRNCSGLISARAISEQFLTLSSSIQTCLDDNTIVLFPNIYEEIVSKYVSVFNSFVTSLSFCSLTNKRLGS